MEKERYDIAPKDSNGNAHGYQEWYWNKLLVRCNFKHGLEIGYEEIHSGTGKTNFYIR
jgi:hypothetical protein